MHALPYVDGVKVPLSTQGSGDGSIGDKGWTKLPSGLIIQWGFQGPYHDLAEGGVEQQVYFPVPFPHKCFVVDTTLTYESGTGVPAGNSYPRNVTSTGFVLVEQEWSGGWEQHAASYWMAIGY